MLTKTQEKLIEILRAELTGTGNADISDLSDSELAAIYNLAKKHNVFTMAGNFLFAKGIDNRVILRDMSYAQQKVEAMDRVFAEITNSLSEAGIPFLPLKGIVMRRLYPKPWMRLSGDIDILIHPEDRPRVIEVLSVISGMQFKPLFSEDHFTSANGITIDVSTTLHGPAAIDNHGTLMVDIWDHASPDAEMPSMYTLSDDMLFTHAIIHMAKHLRAGGCGINHLMDLWVLNHCISMDTQKKSARLTLIKEKHSEKIAEELEKISEKWFSDAKISVDTRLEEYILSGAAHGTQKAKVSAKRNRLSKTQYFLHRLFVPYDYLKELFPQIAGKRWLMPFFEVYRWIYHVKNGRAGIIMNEFKESNTMSDDFIKLNADIMNQYELL